jgi:hypothetical protein
MILTLQSYAKCFVVFGLATIGACTQGDQVWLRTDEQTTCDLPADIEFSNLPACNWEQLGTGDNSVEPKDLSSDFPIRDLPPMTQFRGPHQLTFESIDTIGANPRETYCHDKGHKLVDQRQPVAPPTVAPPTVAPPATPDLARPAPSASLGPLNQLRTSVPVNRSQAGPTRDNPLR